MSVRPAEPDELFVVLDLIVESARRLDAMPSSLRSIDVDAWRESLFGSLPAVNALLAVEGTSPVGYALWYPTFAATLGRRGIWIDDLFVRDRFRRRGHARALMNELRARTTGRVELVADEHSVAAHLYRSLGMEPVERGTRFRWEPAD